MRSKNERCELFFIQGHWEAEGEQHLNYLHLKSSQGEPA